MRRTAKGQPLRADPPQRETPRIVVSDECVPLGSPGCTKFSGKRGGMEMDTRRVNGLPKLPSDGTRLDLTFERVLLDRDDRRGGDRTGLNDRKKYSSVRGETSRQPIRRSAFFGAKFCPFFFSSFCVSSTSRKFCFVRRARA